MRLLVLLAGLFLSPAILADGSFIVGKCDFRYTGPSFEKMTKGQFNCPFDRIFKGGFDGP